MNLQKTVASAFVCRIAVCNLPNAPHIRSPGLRGSVGRVVEYNARWGHVGEWGTETCKIKDKKPLSRGGPGYLYHCLTFEKSSWSRVVLWFTRCAIPVYGHLVRIKTNSAAVVRAQNHRLGRLGYADRNRAEPCCRMLFDSPQGKYGGVAQYGS